MRCLCGASSPQTPSEVLTSAQLLRPFSPLPGVKLSTFDAAKKLLVVGEAAYAEEVALAEAEAAMGGGSKKGGKAVAAAVPAAKSVYSNV